MNIMKHRQSDYKDLDKIAGTIELNMPDLWRDEGYYDRIKGEDHNTV